MALPAGSRIGAYEVLTLLGAGGMGEVYCARDTTLHRDVAVKVLPAAVASDPDRLARFRREAEALAALNHPGIAQIYGFENAGIQPAIVMELVRGEDLSARIARGPIPVGDALAIARQIAAALDAAHERAIVHRDLKPANVKIGDDGHVKILDFGLAKAVGPETTGATSDLADSPTLTARATAIGIILGTAAYMAPEQAKGRPVDRRADIWAFGVVLFEMVSGRRAFDGDDVSEALAAVIKGEPPWDALPAEVPPALHRLLRRCLEKDPRRRLRDLSEGMLQLDEGLARPASPAPAAARPRWWKVAAVASGAVAVVVAAWSASGLLRSAPPLSGPVRFSTTPAALALTGNPRPHIGIAPDGTVIYRGPAGLLAKRPDEYEGKLIVGTANATTPVVSPDGTWLAFVQGSSSDHLIVKVPIRGGPHTVVTAPTTRIYGVDWAPDGTVVYGTREGLFKVPPGTDTPVQLTTASAAVDGGHSWPSFAGSAGLVLFTIGQETDTKLAAVSLVTGQVTELGVAGSSPRYLPTGHVVFVTGDGVLRGAAFDINRMAFTGDAVPLEDRVRVSPFGGADFAVSASGTLVYVSAEDELRVPVWVDRNKKESPLSLEARPYTYPRLSGDGQRLVLATRGREQDVWMWEFARPGLRAFVRNIGITMEAAWAPDQRSVFLPMTRGGRGTIQRLSADGSGQPAQVIESDRVLVPHAVLRDGSALIVSHGYDVALVRLSGEPKLETLVAGASNPALSPNGRWLAYELRDAQSREVFVRPFPRVNEGTWPISSGPGWGPAWSPKGDEIFYGSGGALMRVAVDAESTFSQNAPQVLFEMSAYPPFGLGRHFDVGRDGRFLMLKRLERVPPTINTVLNWSDDVAARAKPR